MSHDTLMRWSFIGLVASSVLLYSLDADSSPEMDGTVSIETYCLAKNIYFESGNQPLAGKIAVAQVVLNRMEHRSYPKDVCGVIYQSKWRTNWKGNEVPVRNMCQFSWFCDGKSDEPLDTKTWESSLKLAQMVLLGYYPDITEGATHYHSIMVDPYWNDSLNETVQITDHIFYK
tara:strand:+ start:1299 stop:1820 length:522 start_codon:yes stop_codon:yes gene_type:complete